MIYLGKFKILKNLITACDYDYIIKRIQKNNKKLLISPIASHTLVRSIYDKNLNKILDSYDFLVPDSQWVRKSINFLYGVKLKDRVYGPRLMMEICRISETKGYGVFFYGNSKEILSKLSIKIKFSFPKIEIVGLLPSKFRNLDKKDIEEINSEIKLSNARIVFVSLGSPLQETVSYKIFKRYHGNVVIVPVGAAFDFFSGGKKQAPVWMQNSGLEWLFRLMNEPKRLWKRYLIYSPLFIFCIFFQKTGVLFNSRNSKGA